MIDPIFDPRLTARRRWKHVVFVIARFFFLSAFRLAFRMKVYGLKNIPRCGGAVVVCNHINFFDPALLLAAGPRPILFMAKAEAFDYPVLKWIARGVGAFPVHRGRPDRAALRYAGEQLAGGMFVGVFPEGTRSKTGGLKEPFDGVSLVALRSAAPVIPCAIFGTEDLPLTAAKDRKRQRRYPKVTVVFGEPFMLELVAPDGSRRSLDNLTDAMMIEIARLLPEEYRGIYRDRVDERHPAVRRYNVRFTGMEDGG